MATVVACGAIAVSAPAAQAALSWNQGSHDFGSATVGTGATPKTFTLSASCDIGMIDPPLICTVPPAGMHTFGAPVVTGPGFALGSPNSCSTGFLSTPIFGSFISCQTTVTFTPAAAGLASGSLSTPVGPDITLTGTGLAAPATDAPAKKKKCKKKKKATGGAAAAKKKCKKKK